MDSDFPVMMAGGRFGIAPLDLQEGLKNRGPLAAAMQEARMPWQPSQLKMAPEGSGWHYLASGAMQPEVTYGA